MSLEREDARFRPIADKYWNARGGSYTDGGSFIFSLVDSGDGAGGKKLICTDKFGKVIDNAPGPADLHDACKAPGRCRYTGCSRQACPSFSAGRCGSAGVFASIRDGFKSFSARRHVTCAVKAIEHIGRQSDANKSSRH